MKFFTKEHEWVEVVNGIASMGISEYAANELGDITYVELPEVDAELDAGDSVGIVESVKAASDIYIPVAGKVVEINSALEDEPEMINAAAESNGWICKISNVDSSKLSELMDENEYSEFLKNS